MDEWLQKIGNSKLTLEEKGMLTVLSLLNPKEVSLTTEALQKQITDRPGTVVRVLRNLERKGILLRIQERDINGQFAKMQWSINKKAVR